VDFVRYENVILIVLVEFWMTVKKILFVLPFLFLLTACSAPVDENIEKKDFLVEVQDFSDFGEIVYISKPGRVVGSQEILVTSQAYGRIVSIGMQNGDKVVGGRPVLQLSDVIMNYKSQLDRSKKNLDSAVLTYKQTEVSLEKAVSDSKLALEQTEHNLLNAQKSAKQMLLQAQQLLVSTDLWEWWQARLTLDKMVTDIEIQVNSFKSQYSLHKTNLLNNMDDVLHFTDTIIGASLEYKTFNDSYEVYLGAKDSRNKLLAKNMILDLYKTRELVQDLKSENLTNSELLENIEVLEKVYSEVTSLLDVVRTVLETSMTNVTFTQSTIDSYIAKIDGFQSSVAGLDSAFTAYSSQVKSLLSDVVVAGVDDNEQINTLAQQQIEIAMNNAEIARSNAEISYEQTKINAENSIFNSELAVKNATLNFQTAQKNKKTQLELLDNAIDQARLAYQDSLTQYNKLSVRAPIAGTISDVLVDIGQEVAVWTPLFKIVSNKDQLVEIYVTAEEYEYLHNGAIVSIEYWEDSYQAEIKSINSVANQNTLYKVIIELNRELKLVGDVVVVKIPVKLENNILPLDVVTTLKNNSWFVYAVNDSGIFVQNISLGRAWGDYIEILSVVSGDLQIVLNDISNFDPKRFNLLVSKKEKNLVGTGLIEESFFESWNLEILEKDDIFREENINYEENIDAEFDLAPNSDSTNDGVLEELIEMLESV